MTSTCVRAVGQGGGHGGSGGHGGGQGGHSSGGFSAGHSSGHSIGHSFAHIFGHHGHGASPEALRGAAPERAEVTPSPESVPWVFDRRPKNRFVFQPRVGLVPRRRAFGFGGCPYGWFDYNFRIGDNWNCSNDGFFFDSFFSGWYSGALPNGPAFGGTTWFEGGTTADSTAESLAEPNPAYPPTSSDSTNEAQSSSRNTTPSPSGMKAEQRITLLQLRDGSMYGLADYWVKDGELHYTTTYEGQNSLPFERIDFEKTVQLNADRGLSFVLPPQSVPR
ncbi:MAG TPA: hypothetical protein VIX91_02725 [Candidatus Acidoferrum sp.]